MSDKSNRSDFQWYITLRIVLLVWEKSTGSLGVRFDSETNEELLAFYNEMNMTLDTYESTRKSVADKFEIRIAQFKTQIRWIQFLINEEGEIPRKKLSSLHDRFIQYEMKNRDIVIFRYAQLNGIKAKVEKITDDGYNLLFFKDACERINKILEDSELEANSLKKSIERVSKTFNMMGISVSPKERYDYMKTTILEILIQVHRKYWSDILTNYDLDKRVLNYLKND